jgi:hypothetical protein
MLRPEHKQLYYMQNKLKFILATKYSDIIIFNDIKLLWIIFYHVTLTIFIRLQNLSFSE